MILGSRIQDGKRIAGVPFAGTAAPPNGCMQDPPTEVQKVFHQWHSQPYGTKNLLLTTNKNQKLLARFELMRQQP